MAIAIAASLYCAGAPWADGPAPGPPGTCVRYATSGEACERDSSCQYPLQCRSGSCARFDVESCHQPGDAGP